MRLRHTLSPDDRPVTEAIDDDGRVVYRGPDAWVRRQIIQQQIARCHPPERGLSLDELGELMRQGAAR